MGEDLKTNGRTTSGMGLAGRLGGGRMDAVFSGLGGGRPFGGALIGQAAPGAGGRPLLGTGCGGDEFFFGAEDGYVRKNE